ncbi:proton-coupled zinc antiporter SLC30A2-like isoform X2 [Paramacrobiotus metropolitanus]|uniref:proton-coupled zinc antiporter SLC30A2-like isoform X2 n=1 Tax=Paramacrobiotus metropolitanus TaxID=2943436 RepID=UPI0024456120|nr:proton-coupled zinc antiporter SLC30A2-like isoform X2 [Paramacrobiotus metropolitanus]
MDPGHRSHNGSAQSFSQVPDVAVLNRGGGYRSFTGYQGDRDNISVSSQESLDLTPTAANPHVDSINSTGSHEHCHFPANALDTSKAARKKLIIASVLCLTFMIGEIVGGYVAGSLAVLTDAAHLLTDFASFMISLFSLWLGARPATKRMSFGWYRAEVIGALTSVIMIWVITGILVYEAVQRIRTGDYEINASVMLITAGVGVAFNIIMGISLHDVGHHHGHSHGHDHGHSHGEEEHSHDHGHDHDHHTSSTNLVVESSNGHIGGNPGQPDSHAHSHGTNINVRAAFIHVVGDLFQSVGVLIAAYIIYYKPEYRIVDPICTFLFSVLVLFTTVTIMRETLNVLMEGIPRGFDFDRVRDSLQEIPGVIRIHNLRIWALTMDKVAVSAHLAIEPTVQSQEVLRSALIKLRKQFNIHESTLQIEDYHHMMVDCEGCREPRD